MLRLIHRQTEGCFFGIGDGDAGIRAAMDTAHRAARSQKKLCIDTMVYVLFNGRAMNEYKQLGPLMQRSKHQHYSLEHWSLYSGWQYAEAIDAVIVKRMKELVSESKFFSLSCDESTDTSRTSQLCIHLYVVTKQWSREELLIRFCPTDLPATAESLERQILNELKKFLDDPPDSEVAQRFVSIATDGASNLCGCHTGVQTRLKKRMPVLMGFHCMAHRLDLAAKAVANSRCAQVSIDACYDLANYYRLGGTRLQTLLESRDLLQLRKVTLKNPGATRWTSHHGVLERVIDLMPALVHALHAEVGLPITKSLLDIRVQLGMLSLLPMLDVLKKLITELQTEDSCVPILIDAVNDSIQHLSELYIGADSWCGSQFALWNSCSTATGSYHADPKRAWVMSKGPDVYNERHSEPVLCYKVQDALVPLHGRLVSTTDRRPGPRPQLINAQQLQLIKSEIQSDMTAAARSVIQNLEHRFPVEDQDAMRSFDIVFPQFWQTYEDSYEQDSLFQDSIDKLGKKFGEKRVVCTSDQKYTVEPLIDVDLLNEQATTYKVFARKAAEQVNAESGGNASVKSSCSAMRSFWVKLSAAGPSSESQVGEFMSLAKLVMSVIGTSVGDERAFSVTSFVREERFVQQLTGEASRNLCACDRPESIH